MTRSSPHGIDPSRPRPSRTQNSHPSITGRDNAPPDTSRSSSRYRKDRTEIANPSATASTSVSIADTLSMSRNTGIDDDASSTTSSQRMRRNRGMGGMRERVDWGALSRMSATSVVGSEENEDNSAVDEVTPTKPSPFSVPIPHRNNSKGVPLRRVVEQVASSYSRDDPGSGASISTPQDQYTKGSTTDTQTETPVLRQRSTHRNARVDQVMNHPVRSEIRTHDQAMKALIACTSTEPPIMKQRPTHENAKVDQSVNHPFRSETRTHDLGNTHHTGSPLAPTPPEMELGHDSRKNRSTPEHRAHTKKARLPSRKRSLVRVRSPGETTTASSHPKQHTSQDSGQEPTVNERSYLRNCLVYIRLFIQKLCILIYNIISGVSKTIFRAVSVLHTVFDLLSYRFTWGVLALIVLMILIPRAMQSLQIQPTAAASQATASVELYKTPEHGGYISDLEGTKVILRSAMERYVPQLRKDILNETSGDILEKNIDELGRTLNSSLALLVSGCRKWTAKHREWGNGVTMWYDRLAQQQAIVETIEPSPPRLPFFGTKDSMLPHLETLNTTLTNHENLLLSATHVWLSTQSELNNLYDTINLSSMIRLLSNHIKDEGRGNLDDFSNQLELFRAVVRGATAQLGDKIQELQKEVNDLRQMLTTLGLRVERLRAGDGGSEGDAKRFILSTIESILPKKKFVP